MSYQIFVNAGLTPAQAEVFDYLLSNSAERASVIAQKIKRPRGVAYKALEDLIKLGLAEKEEKDGQVARFKAGHPNVLENLFAKKENEIAKNKKIYQEVLPELVSQYNLTNNKPNIKYYEGLDGIRRALDDTLKSRTEILTVTHHQSVSENINAINAEYVKKRLAAKIKKKVIVEDTAANRVYFTGQSNELTDVRFAKDLAPFKTGLQIYDNKISYQTFGAENMIAVIIEDKNIYEMQRAYFEMGWAKLITN